MVSATWKATTGGCGAALTHAPIAYLERRQEREVAVLPGDVEIVEVDERRRGGRRGSSGPKAPQSAFGSHNRGLPGG